MKKINNDLVPSLKEAAQQEKSEQTVQSSGQIWFIYVKWKQIQACLIII